MSPLKGWWQKVTQFGTKTEEADLSNIPLEELYASGLNLSLFNEHTQAVRYYEACIKQNSDRPEFYIQLARTYLSLQQREKGIQILQDLLLRTNLPIEIRTSTSKLLLNTLDTLSEPHKVLKTFTELQHFSNPELVFWKQKLLAERTIGYWDEALATLKVIAKMGEKTESSEGDILTARLKARYGVSGQALSGVKKILKNSPKSVDAWLYQLEILRFLKQTRDLQAAWSSFLTVCPEVASTHLEQFENDLFESEVFEQVLPTYQTVLQALKNPPLSLYSQYIKALVRQNKQESLETLALDLIRRDPTGSLWKIFLEEILPHLDGSENFSHRFFKTLQEVSQR